MIELHEGIERVEYEQQESDFFVFVMRQYHEKSWKVSQWPQPQYLPRWFNRKEGEKIV